MNDVLEILNGPGEDEENPLDTEDYEGYREESDDDSYYDNGCLG